MQKAKFNFKDIKGMLSRDEMKKIKGGSSGGCLKAGTSCGSGKTCSASGTSCLCGGKDDGTCYLA